MSIGITTELTLNCQLDYDMELSPVVGCQLFFTHNDETEDETINGSEREIESNLGWLENRFEWGEEKARYIQPIFILHLDMMN